MRKNKLLGSNGNNNRIRPTNTILKWELFLYYTTINYARSVPHSLLILLFFPRTPHIATTITESQHTAPTRRFLVQSGNCTVFHRDLPDTNSGTG